MEKSHQSTKQYFPFHAYLSPTTSSEDLEKGYALYYGDEPFPTEDAWRTRFKAVRPTVEVRGDGTVVLGTSFEDAVPKEFTVILTKDEETDGDGKVEGVEDVGPEDSDAFNLYSDAESKDEIDYDDEAVEDVKMKGAGAEGGKEEKKEKEKDSVSVNSPFFSFLLLCVLFSFGYLRILDPSGWLFSRILEGWE
ncbi:hypothetical protein HYALB_00007695 [Hymenoscyphus albidus]|uniref:Uncharacterized protein n=1 Tax=Hymenoscyphus albidus TaxID=595503 RepID=A0A9N9LLL5_9HELO|nr:hypothetical protein HYALB_00007695 [Hymenoscyphus albidus]